MLPFRAEVPVGSCLRERSTPKTHLAIEPKKPQELVCWVPTLKSMLGMQIRRVLLKGIFGELPKQKSLIPSIPPCYKSVMLLKNGSTGGIWAPVAWQCQCAGYSQLCLHPSLQPQSLQVKGQKGSLAEVEIISQKSVWWCSLCLLWILPKNKNFETNFTHSSWDECCLFLLCRNYLEMVGC